MDEAYRFGPTEDQICALARRMAKQGTRPEFRDPGGDDRRRAVFVACHADAGGGSLHGVLPNPVPIGAIDEAIYVPGGRPNREVRRWIRAFAEESAGIARESEDGLRRVARWLTPGGPAVHMVVEALPEDVRGEIARATEEERRREIRTRLP